MRQTIFSSDWTHPSPAFAARPGRVKRTSHAEVRTSFGRVPYMDTEVDRLMRDVAIDMGVGQLSSTMFSRWSRPARR
jgi:hypothetical protein